MIVSVVLDDLADVFAGPSGGSDDVGLFDAVAADDLAANSAEYFAFLRGLDHYDF